MAEVTFRLPSKVPYGYAELKVEASSDPETLARQYAQYVSAFIKAEREELALIGEGKPTDLNGSVASATEKILTDVEAEDLIKRELGGVEVTDLGDAPWTKEIESTSKVPWDTSESDWDF